jgi:methylglutaconyl-CoA hydratase
MNKYQSIYSERQGHAVTLWLNRPDVHNALNQTMIQEITSFFVEIEAHSDIQLVILRGNGNSFCSGADLIWMHDAFGLSPEENLQECKELSAMFATIYSSSKIVIAAVHGNVYGGGNGLVAVCDFTFCQSETKFSLSETKIGMAAATITPYLLQKISVSALKELVFTARSFLGDEAVRIGLVDRTFSSENEVNQHIDDLIQQICSNGQQALKISKQLINRLVIRALAGEIEQIPAILANIRVSSEAREGFSAFLEKRKPNW